MKKLLSWSDGKKTYMAALALGLLAAAQYLGYVDAEMYKALFALFTGAGVAGLRAAK